MYTLQNYWITQSSPANLHTCIVTICMCPRITVRPMISAHLVYIDDINVQMDINIWIIAVVLTSVSSRSFHIPPFPNPFDYLRPTVRVRSHGRGCPSVPRLVYSAQCHLGHLCPCRCRVSFLPLRWKCSPLYPRTTFSITCQSVTWHLGCFCVCSWRCSEQVNVGSCLNTGCLMLLTSALQLGTRSGVARPLLMFPGTSVLFSITEIPILTNSFHCLFVFFSGKVFGEVFVIRHYLTPHANI